MKKRRLTIHLKKLGAVLSPFRREIERGHKRVGPHPNLLLEGEGIGKRRGGGRISFAKQLVVRFVVISVSVAVLVALFLNITSRKKPAEAAWFNGDWQYRKKIPISNTSTAQTDFQTQLTVDTSALVSSSKLQNDCDDIRLTDINGKLLSYWVEPTTCNTASTLIWVKVPSIAAQSSGVTTDVYFYYGNPTASAGQAATRDVFIRDIPQATVSWPLDDTTVNQSYSRVINPYIPASKNLLNDGDMEAAGTSSYSTGNGAVLTKQTTNSHGGRQVLRIARNTTNFPYATQSPLTTSKLYRLTGYVRSDGSATPQISATNTLFTGTTSTSWQTIDVTFVAASVTLRLQDNTSTGNQYVEFDDLVLSQVNIPATPDVPAAELITDGAMEVAGTGSWTAGNSAALSKQSTSPHGGSQLIRVAQTGGVGLPGAYQTPLIVGQAYRVTGYGRSDGTANPLVRNGATNLFIGVNTILGWQPFDVTFVPTTTDITFAGNTLADGQYVEFDDVSVKLDTSIRQGQLLQDNDMEATGTASWKVNRSPTLTKDTNAPHGGTQNLRVARNGLSNPYAFQDIFNVPKRYRMTGYVKSDGTALPTITDFIQNFFVGTTSTSWQFFDATGIPTATSFLLWDGATTTTHYSEFDDVAVQEVSPFVGIPTNGVLLGQSSGAGGHLTNAYSFVDTDNRVNIYSSDLNSVFNPNEGTLIAWAKVSNGTVWTDGTEHDIVLLRSDISNKVWIHTDTSSHFWIQMNNGGVSSPSTFVPSFTSTNWFQVAITWSKSADQVKAYINGAQTGSTATGLGTWTGNLNSASSMIGSDGNNGTSWSGLINDVRLYGRVLSDEEISSLYNANVDIQAYTTGNYQGHELVRKYNTAVTLGALASEETTPGPIASWNFNEGQGQIVHDDSKNANNGTLGANNTPASDDPTWQTEDQCISGKCLSFDGSNDVITANTISIGTSDFSVSAWIYLTSKASPGGGIIGQGGTDDFRMFVYSDNNIVVQIWDGSQYVGWQDATETPLNVNQWYQVTYVAHRSGTGDIYLNGKLASSTTISSRSAQNISIIPSIGKDTWAVPAQFQGKIDEIKIYKYARSAAQVQSDFQKGAGKVGSAVVAGAKDPAFLNNGLVGYWKMDEATWSGTAAEVVDSSGNANHGQAQGAAGSKAYPSAGKFGNGGFFDGVDDYVDVPNASSLQLTSDYTLSLWVNPNSTQNAFVDILRKDSGAINGYGIEMNITPNSNQYFSGWKDGTNLYCWSTNAFTLTSNTWQLITVTKLGTTRYVYINGILQNSCTGTSATVATSTSNLQFGDWNNGGFSTRKWKGNMDDVRIYNRALSPQEVKDLYNWAPGPVLYYKFDEGLGTSTVNDSSGYGRTTSTMSGFTNNDWQPGKYGDSLRFGQHTTYISAGDPGDGSLDMNGDFTVCAWTKSTTTGQYQNIANKMIFDASGNSGFYFRIAPANVFNFGVRDINNNGNAPSAATTVTDGQWHHGCGVRSGSILKIYTDGRLENSSFTIANGPIYNSEPLLVGRFIGTNPFFGNIDEVKVYNYARSPGQIVEDMNGGHPIGGSPVGSELLWYKFNEQQGQTVNNAGNGGSALNGTLGADSSPASDDPTWKTDTDCKANGCLYFDGGDYVSGSNSTSFDGTASPITVTAWIKMDPSSGGMVVSKGGSTAGGWYIDMTGTPQIVLKNASGTTAIQRLSLGGYHSGSWIHLAVVITEDTTTLANNDIQIYVNGVLDEGAITRTVLPTVSVAKVKVGARGEDGAPNSYFKGSIDDVKIYNAALTADQIKLDMNAGSSLNFNTGGPLEASQSADTAGNPPIAYWPMNERTGQLVNDISGNNYQGTLGDTSGIDVNDAAWGVGKYGGGTVYSGVSRVEFPKAASVRNLAQFTIEGWINPTTLPTSGNEKAIYMEDVTDGSGTARAFVALSNNRDGCGTNVIDFQFRTGNAASTKYVVCGATTLSTGLWYHVVAIFDSVSDVHKVFLNGILDGSLSQAVGAIENTPPTNIISFGRVDSTNQFSGAIDDVKLYNYARTQSQVAFDYNRGGPIGWWKFNECQGTTANDNSGNGNNGTINIVAGGGGGNVTSAGTCNTAGTAWGNGATGKFNSSLSFDGIDDYLEVTSPSKLLVGNLSNYTISAWFKTTDTGNFHTIYGEARSSSATPGIQLLIGYFFIGDVAFEYRDDASNYGYVRADVNSNDGNWHHLVAVRESASNFRLYYDGKSVDTETSVTPGTMTTDKVCIGAFCRNGTIINYFPNQIDDVRVYNYSLSASQVLGLYNEGSAVRFGPVTGSP